MAKEVELNIKISKDGKVTVEPKGTSGENPRSLSASNRQSLSTISHSIFLYADITILLLHRPVIN